MTTYEDVHQAFLACRRSAGREVAHEIVDRFGGDLESVAQSKWPALIAAFESAANDITPRHQSHEEGFRAKTIYANDDDAWMEGSSTFDVSRIYEKYNRGESNA